MFKVFGLDNLLVPLGKCTRLEKFIDMCITHSFINDNGKSRSVTFSAAIYDIDWIYELRMCETSPPTCSRHASGLWVRKPGARGREHPSDRCKPPLYQVLERYHPKWYSAATTHPRSRTCPTNLVTLFTPTTAFGESSSQASS